MSDANAAATGLARAYLSRYLAVYAQRRRRSGGNQFGPVITLNNYIPLAKYELDKNPSDEDVRKICTQIAASLKAILAANPSAFAQ